jgi:hypothetical protein
MILTVEWERSIIKNKGREEGYRKTPLVSANYANQKHVA